MSDTIYAFDPVIPAGRAMANPITLPLSIPVGQVDRIEARIPPGPSFVAGFQLWVSGGLVIPYNSGQWIYGDDDLLTWDLTDQPESGRWQLVGFNTGLYDHTIYFRFFLTLGSPGGVPLPDPIPIITTPAPSATFITG